MPKPLATEVKTFALKLDSPPDEEGRFSGYAAVFGNVDHDNDIIEPGAFTKTLQERPQVPILFQHDRLQPIGVSVAMVEDTKGLKVEGQLAVGVQRADETRTLMQMGALKGLSIGYRAVKRTFQGGVRHLKELELSEWSPVVFAANDLAAVDNVKGRKWLGQYSATESVDCLLDMMASGADFMAQEVEEGDTDDAARMEQVLSSLAKLLASELSEVATGESDDADAPDVIYVEMMSRTLEPAIKRLEALRVKAEPEDTTQPPAAASKEDVEPEVIATLRDLTAGMRSRVSA